MPSQKSGEIYCKIGPIEQIIDGNAWQIFGCDDGESIGLAYEDESLNLRSALFVLKDGKRLTVQRIADDHPEILASAYRWARGLDLEELAKLHAATLSE